jgi:putative transposase
MPHVKVYIHFVWSTKDRFPYLNSTELRKKVWKHMRDNARKKGIFIDFINGYSDHCHCLVSMGVDQTIKEIAQLIKGESSFWINNEKLCNSKFNWQNDYFAASVSESLIEATRNYIKNQEEHHKIKSFGDEYNEFLEKHGFERLLD